MAMVRWPKKLTTKTKVKYMFRNSKTNFEIRKHISKFKNTFRNSKTHFEIGKHISIFKNTFQNMKTHFEIGKHISKFENTFVPGLCQFFVVKKEWLPLLHTLWGMIRRFSNESEREILNNRTLLLCLLRI